VSVAFWMARRRSAARVGSGHPVRGRGSLSVDRETREAAGGWNADGPPCALARDQIVISSTRCGLRPRHSRLRAGLTAPLARRTKPYRVRPAALGSVLPGINLDKALALADALEDLESAARMQLRKWS
jgi:hypothetical protein